MYRLETIETFGHKNEIRMQCHNLFQTWIDCAANLGFVLGVGGVITVVGVSDEMILQTECVDGFRQTRRERHDALDRLGNANRAAGFVRNFPEDGGCGRDRRCALRTRERRASQQGRNSGEEGAAEARACKFVHESSLTREFHCSNKKAPRDTLGRMAWLFLAKSTAFCGTGGWPGLRLFSRLQWRGRGRLPRASPLPLPAN